MKKSKRTIINMLSGGTAYAVPMAINFFATPFIVKSLGTEGYGLQNLVNLIIGYLTVMDMGLDVAITKYLAEDRAKNNSEAENRLLNTSLLLYVTLGVFGAFVIFLSAKYLSISVFSIPQSMQKSATIVFQIASVGFLFSMLNSFTKSVCCGLQRFEYSSLIGVTVSMGGTGLGIAVLLHGMGIIAFVSSKIIFIVMVPFVVLLLYKKILPDFILKVSFDKEMIKRLWSYMAYGLILRISGPLLSRLDQTLLGIWIGVSAVGLYSIPFMIASMIGYGISSIIGFVLPMVSEMCHTNRLSELQKLFNRLTIFITIVCSAAFIPLIVLGKKFLILWMGNDFAQETYKILFLLLVAGYFSTNFVTILNSVVIGIGKVKTFTIYALIRGIALGLFCVILIKPLGALGAAIAVLCTDVVDVIYFNYCVRKYLKIEIFKIVFSGIVKSSMPGIILAIGLVLVSGKIDSWLSLIGVVIIFEVLLLGLCYVSGIIGDEEKGIIRRMLRVKALKT